MSRNINGILGMYHLTQSFELTNSLYSKLYLYFRTHETCKCVLSDLMYSFRSCEQLPRELEYKNLNKK